MNIGIFGGTFNPVHNGHVTALKDFIRFAGLDRVFVFPTGIPPHKALTAGASNADRLQMVKLALGTMATVDDYEIRKQGKSYTVDTISYLKQQFPKDALFLYVGSDMLLAFETARGDVGCVIPYGGRYRAAAEICPAFKSNVSGGCPRLSKPAAGGQLHTSPAEDRTGTIDCGAGSGLRC